MVQVNDVIIVLRFQFFYHQFPTMRQHMQLINVWIVLNNGKEFIFYQKMNFCIRNLFFQATNDRSSEYNITDGRKTYDEEFGHTLFFNKVQVFIKSFLCHDSSKNGDYHNNNSRINAPVYISDAIHSPKPFKKR